MPPSIEFFSKKADKRDEELQTNTRDLDSSKIVEESHKINTDGNLGFQELSGNNDESE